MRCWWISLPFCESFWRKWRRMMKSFLRRLPLFLRRMPFVVAHIAILRLFEDFIDQREQLRVVLLQLLAGMGVVVHALGGRGGAVEIGLPTFGPVFLVVRRGVGVLP